MKKFWLPLSGILGFYAGLGLTKGLLWEELGGFVLKQVVLGVSRLGELLFLQLFNSNLLSDV